MEELAGTEALKAAYRNIWTQYRGDDELEVRTENHRHLSGILERICRSFQQPINVLDAHYRSFQKEVVPVCLKKGVGVIGMKGLAGGHPQGRLLSHLKLAAPEAYRFCLSQPVSAQVMGITLHGAVARGHRAGAEFQAHERGGEREAPGAG